MVNPPQLTDGHLDRADHLELDELADAAEGLLAPERMRQVDAHLRGCADCRSLAGELAGVTDQLATAPAPSMPDAVFARLQQTLAHEHALRQPAAESRPAGHPGQSSAPGASSGAPYADKPSPRVHGGGRVEKPRLAEHFADTLGTRRGMRARFAGGALAATALAAAVGFGGYVASASAGAAEPSQDQPMVVSPGALHASAAAEVAEGDLSSYRFTQAWFCVRKVTDGRITGIRSTVLNGDTGYLVFLDRGNGVRAVFVTGCDTDTPKAGPTVTLPGK
ncbi:anti-sigma factor family protein [Microlunatus elymi]|nr:zf-HC2 domain-containing protein [Microlunatus elymi]